MIFFLNKSQSWASAARSRGACPPYPWIFKHGTNIVAKGSKVLFSALLAIFGIFSVAPLLLEEAK